MTTHRPSLSFPESKIPQRILVRGVNWLGDAVMTTPALMHLRERFPKASILLMAPEKLAELWWKHPAIDEVLAFSPQERLLSLAQQLRSLRCDVGIALPNSTRSALELWLARIPIRLGYRGNARGLLLTHAIARRKEEVRMRKKTRCDIRQDITQGRPRPQWARESHQLFSYLHLISHLGASDQLRSPHLSVSETEQTLFRNRFLDSRTLVSSHRILGLNAGAEYGPAKRWPVQRFIDLLIQSQKRGPHLWILFGGPNDVPTIDTIRQAALRALGSQGDESLIVSVAGRTSLRELMAGLSLCEAVVTNDTGPMHVAAALGVPVVVPFGSTSPELTGPGLPGDPRHQLVVSTASCAPCFLRECPIDFRCMQEITADHLLDRLDKALQESAKQGRPK